MKPKLNKDGIFFSMLFVGVFVTVGYGAYKFSQSISAIQDFIYGVAKGVGF